MDVGDVVPSLPVICSLLLLPLPTEAEKQAEVSHIQYEQKIMEKESQKKISEIGDSTELARVRSQADGRLYAAQQEAESNKV